ncbi:hypothetical protein DFH27DRAFT_521629 [Peziza echinospora]|nr:hypothetical protein DFH27DRAFT_521629 [Peziza echinospora]
MAASRSKSVFQILAGTAMAPESIRHWICRTLGHSGGSCGWGREYRRGIRTGASRTHTLLGVERASESGVSEAPLFSAKKVVMSAQSSAELAHESGHRGEGARLAASGASSRCLVDSTTLASGTGRARHQGTPSCRIAGLGGMSRFPAASASKNGLWAVRIVIRSMRPFVAAFLIFTWGRAQAPGHRIEFIVKPAFLESESYSQALFTTPPLRLQKQGDLIRLPPGDDHECMFKSVHVNCRTNPNAWLT